MTDFVDGAEAMRAACVAISQPLGDYSNTPAMQERLKVRMEITDAIHTIPIESLPHTGSALKTAAVTLRAFATGDAPVPPILKAVTFVAMGALADWLWPADGSAADMIRDSKAEELRSLLLLERQSAIGQVAEITRLRELGKRTETELEEATLARGRLRLWLEFIHHNCTSPEAREYAGQAINGAGVPEDYDWDERSGR
jgi:hypothetical protein